MRPQERVKDGALGGGEEAKTVPVSLEMGEVGEGLLLADREQELSEAAFPEGGPGIRHPDGLLF